MNDSINLSDDERAILTAFRNGDRRMRARIFLATMSHDGDPTTPDEDQRLEFVGAYLDCNEKGRTHIGKVMALLASGKSCDEVDRYLASVDGVRPKAEVINLVPRLP